MKLPTYLSLIFLSLFYNANAQDINQKLLLGKWHFDSLYVFTEFKDSKFALEEVIKNHDKYKILINSNWVFNKDFLYKVSSKNKKEIYRLVFEKVYLEYGKEELKCMTVINKNNLFFVFSAGMSKVKFYLSKK